VILASDMARERYRRFTSIARAVGEKNWVPLTIVSTIIGMGLGALTEGIFLHQVMEGRETADVKALMTVREMRWLWDVLFFLIILLVISTGVVLLWRLLFKPGINRSGYLLVGGGLLGWGTFNIVEGVINHHLAAFHRLGGDLYMWSAGLLALSSVFLIGGYVLIRQGIAAGE